MHPSRSSQSIVVIVPDSHEYKVPLKAVRTPQDMQLWEKSEAYSEYVGFILALNEAVKGKSQKVDCHFSGATQNILELLESLDYLIDEVEPIKQPQRFGNQAFRTWYSFLKDRVISLLHSAIPSRFHRAVPEIMVYLVEGFGNSTRIDYGTGHEISFLMFLCCLFKIGWFQEQDKVAVGCIIFPKYLNIVRKLQQTYRMEPAGSHGVWSLDDYQFVPFILGSSQLIGHSKIEPSSFLNERILQEYSKDYMFLGCIEYINQVKTGPFAEHSNQLWGISGVGHWAKVNQGLIKMYKVEVLGKFPVVQHIAFGSLLPFKLVVPDTNARTARLSMRPSFSIPIPRTSVNSQVPSSVNLMPISGSNLSTTGVVSEIKTASEIVSGTETVTGTEMATETVSVTGEVQSRTGEVSETIMQAGIEKASGTEVVLENAISQVHAPEEPNLQSTHGEL